jgi:hypothetical protein
LARNLCQVVGLNQNYISKAGTLYHIQIEDRGPIHDPVLERDVRRVNVIIYANYGEPNARIIFGRDHDFEDVRTQEHNRLVEQQIKQIAARAREVVEEQETRRVERIKAIIRDYHLTKGEPAKRALEEQNGLFPFVFSRAWVELRQERARQLATAASAAGGPAVAEAALEEGAGEVVYPLDPGLRARVLQIERMVAELGRDLDRLRTLGRADAILVQACDKLIARARESICSREPSDFTTRRLEMTSNSLMTTWRQVQSRLRA